MFIMDKIFNCGKRRHRHDAYDDSLDMLHLPKLNREVIKQSYQHELNIAKRQYYISMILFAVLNNIITIGSVLVVSFMSIEKTTLVSGPVSEGFFWAAWITSVVVVAASKIVGVFSLQKRFVTDKIVLEKYKSEGWKYVAGIGHYTDKNTIDAYKTFISRVQKIKMSAVENYSSSSNSNSMFASSKNLRGSAGIYQGGGDAMYMQASGLNSELFSKFGADDIELDTLDDISVVPSVSPSVSPSGGSNDNIAAVPSVVRVSDAENMV